MDVKISPLKQWNNGLRMFEKRLVRGLSGPSRGGGSSGIAVTT